MAAYAAVARLGRADVRRVPATRPDPERPVDLPPSATLEELAGRPFGEPAVEWWRSVREQVAMTTFFLFDPESWR